jgi:hypothetical protein
MKGCEMVGCPKDFSRASTMLETRHCRLSCCTIDGALTRRRSYEEKVTMVVLEIELE